MPTNVLTPTILAGQSLSDSIDTVGGTAVICFAPALWTPANISFQLSTDAVLWEDLFEPDGTEIIMPLIAGTAILFRSEIQSAKGAYIKIRSGSRYHPVVQEQDAQFRILVQT
jgi:hypothetical protein